jgi:hypothetical protein
MRARDLATLVALAVLACVAFSATDATAEKKIVALDDQVHALDFSKAVPGQLNYQGFLANAADSSAVTATLEMTFRLYDSETKGAELWSETHPAVEVSEGLFQVLLGSVTSFPDGLFGGATLWLQTEVGPEVLAPRKPLVSVAYSRMAGEAEHAAEADLATEAQHAVHADTADYAPSAGAWTVDGDNVYRETGKVGIGITSPLTELDVAGSVNATTYYGDGSNLTGIAGAPDDDWTIAGTHVYCAQPGSVGIGTASPENKLHVAGDVQATTYYGDGSHLTGISGTTDNDWTISGDDIYHQTGNVGIGTSSMDEKLHIENSASGGSAFLKIETSNATNWHEAGIRIETPQNRWHLRMDDDTNNNIPDGALGLRSQDLGAEVMVWQDNGNVGIGKASPISKLDISGAVNTDSLYQIGGTTVLSAAGTENILVGIAAGGNNTGTYVTCVGDSAGHFNQANYNTFIGRKAGRTNTTGQRNTFMGNWAGRSNTGGNDNVFLGTYTGANNTTGTTNTFIGNYAGNSNTEGHGNTFVGFSTGSDQTYGYDNSFFGMYAGRSNAGHHNTFIGVSAGNDNETGSYNTFVGQSAGVNNTTGEENTFLGTFAGVQNNAGTYNTFVGYESGYSNIDAYYNTFLGHQAGYSNTEAGANTFLGSRAGYSNTTGSNNTYVGMAAGSIIEEGSRNVFLGVDAGLFKSSGDENTFIGYSTGYGNSTGDNNTFLGHGAGYNNTGGEGNVFVGHNAGYYESGSNKLLIANGGDTSDVLIYGDFSTRRLAFGTLNPDVMLHIENSGDGESAFLKIETSHPSNWHEAGIRIETPQNRWHLRMDDDLNNQIPDGALGLRSQDTGVEVMTWAENGNVGIGTWTTSPTEKLHVVGNIYCTGKLTSDGGNDPPYVLYNKESRLAIIDRVAAEVPEDKQDGAVLFWNGGRKRFEVYLPEDGEFRDLNGNLLCTIQKI